jgi:archaellin
MTEENCDFRIEVPEPVAYKKCYEACKQLTTQLHHTLSRDGMCIKDINKKDGFLLQVDISSNDVKLRMKNEKLKYHFVLNCKHAASHVKNIKNSNNFEVGYINKDNTYFYRVHGDNNNWKKLKSVKVENDTKVKTKIIEKSLPPPEFSKMSPIVNVSSARFKELCSEFKDSEKVEIYYQDNGIKFIASDNIVGTREIFGKWNEDDESNLICIVKGKLINKLNKLSHLSKNIQIVAGKSNKTGKTLPLNIKSKIGSYGVLNIYISTHNDFKEKQ